jgi:hypothetical protein
MARVFTYKIIACGLTYTSDGISHENAVNNFISNPQTIAGYRIGNYDADDGEQLVVIGPTQENREREVSKVIILRESRSLVPMTIEQLVEEESIPAIKEQVKRMHEEYDDIRLLVRRERQTPIGDLLEGAPDSFDDSGVWLKGKLIPWIDITGAEPLAIKEPV